MPADSCSCHATVRPGWVRRGLRLEYLTVGWNLVEGAVSLWAALGAASVALIGFGIDSFVETASGLVLIWRLGAERRARDTEEIERLDHRAHRLVGVSLFALAAYIAFDAAEALWRGEPPAPTWLGVAITALSLVVMAWLARAKRQVARDLGSRALAADSMQTTACFWMSLVTLAGIGLNATLSWWWADPVAALFLAVFLVREGAAAWRGEDCCCAPVAAVPGPVCHTARPAAAAALSANGCTDGAAAEPGAGRCGCHTARPVAAAALSANGCPDGAAAEPGACRCGCHTARPVAAAALSANGCTDGAAAEPGAGRCGCRDAAVANAGASALDASAAVRPDAGPSAAASEPVSGGHAGGATQNSI